MPDDLPSLSPMSSAAEAAAAAFPLNRVVVLATPLLASSAAVVGGWLVDNFPLRSGRVSEATRQSVMLAASASATALAFKWLDGWQQHVDQEFRIENGLITTESVAVRDAGAEQLGLDGDAALGASDLGVAEELES